MVYIAANGPRWGEIAGLRVGRIGFRDEPSICVEEQLTRGKGSQMVTTTTKHRSSERTLSIPDWLGDMLFIHLYNWAFSGGASKNRTCDLSIISAAL
jgi:hypothetical protein